MNRIRSTISILLFIGGGVLAQSESLDSPAYSSTVALTTDEVVHRALESNFQLQNVRYELVKTNSDLLKNESNYSWKIVGNLNSQQTKLPFNQNNVFTGTKISNDTLEAGIEKKLKATGTYFKVSTGYTRFDSNAFENSSVTPPSLQALTLFAIPPLYTDVVSLTLQQDLMKNAFGFQDKNKIKILENQSEINKANLTMQLSQLVVNSLIDYWDYAIKVAQVQTYEKVMQNTQDIRNLTVRKQNLGLSENFEVNQWNAVLAQTESQLEQTKLDRNQAKRKLRRTIGLPQDVEISDQVQLFEEIPFELNFDEDLKYAFGHRVDYQNLQKQKQIAELQLQNAEDSALPTLNAQVLAQTQSQNMMSVGHGFSDTKTGVQSFKYKNYNTSVNLVYPIKDKGIYAGIRDATISQRQILLQEQDMRNQIRDEIRTQIETLKASQKILENANRTARESQAYYNGVVRSFRQGRANAVTVKNALDQLVQDQLQQTQSKINFNINLMRYYLAKNQLLEHFELNVDNLIPKRAD